MISTQRLIEKAKSLESAGSLTADQLMQLSSIEKFTDAAGISVSTLSDLPDAENNKGRLVYVVAEEDYYFSRGFDWTTVFDSTYQVIEKTAYGVGGNSASASAIGDGTVVSRSSPVTVAGGITNWSQVSARSNQSLGITDGGIAYAWGNNTWGQLGSGNTIPGSSPVTVVGGITNWSQISAGNQHSLGIAGGVAYAWGNNNSGQLGDDSTSNRSSPVTVVGGITDWSQVSAGYRHNLGVTSSGVAYAWGNNNSGQLGDDSIIAKSSPVTVVGGITNWSQVSVDIFQSLGLTETGILYAWGNNTSGRLGDGTSVPKSSPVTVVGGITNWSQISAGNQHCLGISNGILWAWGESSNGRLGNGNAFTDRSSPVTVVGGITNWSQISAGNQHCLGIAGGIAYAWGIGSSGQLGQNDLINTSSPVTVLGGITDWAQVSAGNAQSLFIRIIDKGFNIT